MAEVKNPNWGDFLVFDEKIKSIGFRKIGKRDQSRKFFRLEIRSLGRKKKGTETGYEYTNNGYTVKVWTSVLEPEAKLRDVGEDAGWVIIVKDDKIAYSARSFLRTDGFSGNFCAMHGSVSGK